MPEWPDLHVLRGRLRIFDWNFAAQGPPELDVAPFAQSIAAEGGPAPERFVAAYGDVLPLRPELLASAVAGTAGYFAERAWQPDIPGLPRVRTWQRRQLAATLAWAARLLSLPEPLWVSALRR